MKRIPLGLRLLAVQTIALCAGFGAACGMNVRPVDAQNEASCPPVGPPSPMLPSPPALGGEANQEADPPPPLAGGTLATTKDGDATIVVASVPDAARLTILTLRANPPATGDAIAPGFTASNRELVLQRGDDPGRVAFDAARRAHVVLRGARSVLTVDLSTFTMQRREVCPAPRGIAYDAASDALQIACATGELVTLPAGGGAPTRRVFVERDLRDVVVRGSSLLVTRFRDAELLTLDASGAIAQRATLPSVGGRKPHVAWRMSDGGGRVAIVYELESTAPIDVRSTLPNVVTYGAPPSEPSAGPAVVTAVALYDGVSFTRPQPSGQMIASPTFDVAVNADSIMIPSVDAFGGVSGTPGTVQVAVTKAHQATAIALGTLAGRDAVFLQTRSPSKIQVYQRSDPGYFQVIEAPISGATDTGLDLFHTPTSALIACASCHPEGGDDGHTWSFIQADEAPDGGCADQRHIPAAPDRRRTQSLRGGVSAPFHWEGDLPTMPALVNEVLTRRMHGGALSDEQQRVFERFIASIPRAPTRKDLDPARVASGRALFEGKGACVTCHAGDKLTSRAKVDVGRGAFEVPSLIGVGARAPFMHDGCASTLSARFDPSCGGDKHGGALTQPEQRDVIAYLESL